MKSVILATLLTLASASASILVTWEQVGSDVVISYSGSISLTGYADSDNIPAGSDQVGFSDQSFTVARGAGDAYLDGSVSSSGTGLNTFNTGPFGLPLNVSIASGSDFFGFTNAGVFLPAGYTSDAPLSGSVTLANRTLAEFAATGFDNTLAWAGPGSNVIYQTIPEPSSALLLLSATPLFARKR
ncbi:MAG: hypothetical protein ACQKBY_01170 [Verrucomicrobiales bacterium]